MSVAPYLFVAAVLLGSVCNFRLVVRAFGFAHAWRGNRPTGDEMIEWLGSIRLRDTFVLEVLGLAIACAMAFVAIGLMQG